MHIVLPELAVSLRGCLSKQGRSRLVAVGQSHHAQQQRRAGQFAAGCIASHGGTQPGQGRAKPGEVGINLRRRKRQDLDCRLQDQLCAQRGILGAAATHYRLRAGTFQVGIDCSRTSRPLGVARPHLIEAIEQWQDRASLHPHLPQLGRHLIALLQLRHQPVSQGGPHRPGRELKDHRDGQGSIGLGGGEQLLSQSQKHGCLTATGCAEDKQLVAGLLEDRQDGGAGGERIGCLVRQTDNLLPGLINRVRPGLHAQFNQYSLVQRVFEYALNPESPYQTKQGRAIALLL